MRVVITGGTSGMGKSAVKLFLEKGWQVMALDLNEEAGQRLLDEF